MTKEIIKTNKAPSAIGTYSQAVKVGNTVYLSGQIPLDPISMEVVSNQFTEQTQQVFQNIKAVCEAAGGDLSKLVKLNVYLTDLNNFAVINEVMTTFMSAPYPARAAVEVSRLPKDVLIEIEGIMVL